jgi:hypothetical protein
MHLQTIREGLMKELKKMLLEWRMHCHCWNPYWIWISGCIAATIIQNAEIQTHHDELISVFAPVCNTK